MPTKIMIVEDEAITAADIKSTLKSMGFEVVSTAFEGKEAIQKAKELKPDLILMDIFLRGELDGIEAARKIMTFSDIPIIYLTALSDRKTLKRAKLTKPYGFLTKPFSQDVIVNTIETALYKHELDKKLKESEEKFQLMYQDAPLPYQSLDESGFITEVNQAWLDTLGYSRDEVIGKWFVDFLKTNNAEKFLENFPKFKAKGEICNIEFEMKHKNGSIIIAEFNGKISHDDRGNFQRTQCIFQDITKQKEVEKKIKESNERYRQFFNNPLLGFALCKIFTDENGEPVDFVYLEVNNAFENLTGLKREEVLNKKVTDVIVPEEVADIIKIYGKVALTGESTIFEYPIPSLDKYFEISAFSPRNKHFIAFFTDITKRKKVEEELKKSRDNFEEQVKARTLDLQIERDKLNTILNTTKNRICVVNSDYKLDYINPAMEKDFGINKGQNCYEYFYNKTDICAGCKIQKAFEGNVVEWKQHSLRLDKVYDVLAAPILNTNGSNSVLVILNDITKHEKTKKQLKESVQELKHSNEELQSFAYITSHDLQEPLRTMASYAGLLKQRYEGKFDKDADDFLDYMIKGASRMKEMIQGLLDYSRVGTRGGEFMEFNSEDALNHAIYNLQSAIKECHAEITHDKLPLIVADSGQITRVFQNLIGNALKFRREEITPKIHISARKIDYEFIFSVHDNGIGIEEQYIDKIFEIFKRLHAIDEYKGAGIGLAIVKRIIARHGGRVWVESDLSKGSTFYFTIPVELIEKEDRIS